MALVERWVRTANNGSTYVSIFGTPLVAGGGGGTSVSPYGTWAEVSTLLLETGRAADDLVVYFHPASVFLGGAVGVFATFTDLGRGTSWKSVTLKEWPGLKTADPRLNGWVWSINTFQPLTAWTQGFNNAGTWTAGVGDIWRSAAFPCSFVDWRYVQLISGHDRQDTRGNKAISHTFVRTVAELQPGYFTVADAGGGNIFALIKTGDNTKNPPQTWTHETVYMTSSNNGRHALLLNQPNVLTMEDFGFYGGRIEATALGSGSRLGKLTFVRPRIVAHSKPLWLSTDASVDDSYAIDGITMIDPDFDAWAMQNNLDTQSRSAGGADGIYYSGKFSGIYIRNPKVSGFSHTQMAGEGGTQNYRAPWIGARRITAANQFTTYWSYHNGAALAREREIEVVVSGAFTGTVTLQNSADASTFNDMATYTVPGTYTYSAGTGTRWYRAGCKTGELTSGTPLVTVRQKMPVYIALSNDELGTRIGGVRTMRIEIVGSFTGNFTLERSADGVSGWTVVRTYTAATVEDYNDGEAGTLWYYRLNGADVLSGDAGGNIKHAIWPRNVQVHVTDYSNGKSTLTGAPDTSVPANCGYFRCVSGGGVNMEFGPLRIRNQTTQSQLSGIGINARGLSWDSSCVGYSDATVEGNSAGNYNVGSNLAAGPGPWTYDFPNQTVNFIGTKHQLNGNLLATWNSQALDGQITFEGGLVVDDGDVRYRPEVAAAQGTQTRRRAAFHSNHGNTVGLAPYQNLWRLLCVLTGTEGLAQRKVSGQTPNASATITNYPTVNPDNTGELAWPAQYVRDNRSGTLASFGFDAGLNYVGPKLTQARANAKSIRGYR